MRSEIVRIAIGSDHAGFNLKRFLTDELVTAGYEIADFGANSDAPVDYPDIAQPLAEAVAAHEADLGVLICSNGVGMSVVGNKVPGVRAALCSDGWSARRAREHTDCNVLALGSYAVGTQVALEVLRAFLEAQPQGGRHAQRVAKIDALDARRAPPALSERSTPR